MRVLPLLLLSLFATVSSAQALTPGTGNRPELKWNWLTEDDKARLLKAIPPAPQPGSDTDKKDLETVRQIQASRTPALVAEATDDRKFRLDLVSRVLGPQFTAANYPATFALLNGANQDEYVLSSTLKTIYRRHRPYQDHPEIKKLFDVDGYSYPSGHSTGAHTFADILDLLFPGKKTELDARADAVGWSRVVAGVHYPSDVEAGKKLARALVDALAANPDFQKALAAAKAEVSGRPLN